MKWSGKNLRPTLLDDTSSHSQESGDLHSGSDSVLYSLAQGGGPLLLSWFCQCSEGPGSDFLAYRITGRIQWGGAFDGAWAGQYDRGSGPYSPVLLLTVKTFYLDAWTLKYLKGYICFVVIDFSSHLAFHHLYTSPSFIETRSKLSAQL